jgi:HAD superfamily hydrolase (TIGR01549 family)
MGLILDLDLTLVDSSCADAKRRAKQWPEVYPLIKTFPIYDGIADFLKFVKHAEIPTCIVTSSPQPYCTRVLDFLGVKFPTVCYHDTKNHKPHPEPIRKALKDLGVSAGDAMSVGDDPKDVLASKAAGVHAVAATWGCVARNDLLRAGPDTVCDSVEELMDLVRVRYAI